MIYRALCTDQESRLAVHDFVLNLQQVSTNTILERTYLQQVSTNTELVAVERVILLCLPLSGGTVPPSSDMSILSVAG